MQMKFYYDLYVSEDFKAKKNRKKKKKQKKQKKKMKDKKEKLIRKLQKNKLQPSVYVISLAQGRQNHLEFCSCVLFKQHVYETMPLFIVGIANGYVDALYMTEEIVNDVYRETGDTDIRGYFEKRQKEYEEGRG